MEILYQYIEETASTNQLMKNMLSQENLPEGFVVQAGFQVAGRGQGANHWESARDQNLLFSLLLRPAHIAIDEQFLISQIVSLGIVAALSEIVPDASDAFSIKWPNDIYWNQKKIAGILIENTWMGAKIASSVVGVGLNINQEVFESDAPNPISLCQISGMQHLLDDVFEKLITQIDYYYEAESPELVRRHYMERIFRKEGFHLYRADEEVFEARIAGVEKDGRLIIEKKDGSKAGFYFKEVEFVL